MKEMKFRIAACVVLAIGLLLAAHAGWAQATERVITGHGHLCQAADDIAQGSRKVWESADGVLHVRDQKIYCWVDGDLHGWMTGYESYNYDSMSGRLDAHGYNVFYGFLRQKVNSAMVNWQKQCTPDGEVSTCVRTGTWHFSDGRKADMIWSADLGAPVVPYSGIITGQPRRN